MSKEIDTDITATESLLLNFDEDGTLGVSLENRKNISKTPLTDSGYGYILKP